MTAVRLPGKVFKSSDFQPNGRWTGGMRNTRCAEWSSTLKDYADIPLRRQGNSGRSPSGQRGWNRTSIRQRSSAIEVPPRSRLVAVHTPIRAKSLGQSLRKSQVSLSKSRFVWQGAFIAARRRLLRVNDDARLSGVRCFGKRSARDGLGRAANFSR